MTNEVIWTAPAQQSAFRGILDAMSRPGELASLPGPRAAKTLLATLLDHSTTLHDRDGLLDSAFLRLLGAGTGTWADAGFILAAGQAGPADDAPRLGTLASPEGGATVVLEGQSIDSGDLRLDLSGPGIGGIRQVFLSGFDASWFQRRAEWVRYFPLGADFILTAADRALCLPRTTEVRVWAM